MHLDAKQQAPGGVVTPEAAPSAASGRSLLVGPIGGARPLRTAALLALFVGAMALFAAMTAQSADARGGSSSSGSKSASSSSSGSKSSSSNSSSKPASSSSSGSKHKIHKYKHSDCDEDDGCPAADNDGGDEAGQPEGGSGLLGFVVLVGVGMVGTGVVGAGVVGYAGWKLLRRSRRQQTTAQHEKVERR